MNTEGIGISAMMLGAGREKKEDAIDPLAGIVLCKKTGDYVKKGETLAVLYTSEESRLKDAEAKYFESVKIKGEKPKKEPLIYARVTKDGVEEKAD